MTTTACRPTVYIETYGCQMNVYDSAAIGGILDAHGYRRVEDPDQADVVLLNTCSVREHAEQKVLSRLGELRSRHRRGLSRAAILGVCGCMAERMRESLASGEKRADLVVGVDRYGDLPQLLERAMTEHAPAVAVGHRGDVHYVAPPEAYPTHNSHLVTIHKGCDYRCTYCIVPDTRGPQREKAPEVIVDEIERIVAAGGREVTLLGQNVTAYRAPGMDFAGLLRRLAEIAGLERIRFLTGHPKDTSGALLETIAAIPQVCPWLHLPAQSGSNRILRRMKRLYTAQEYLQIVHTARRLIPTVTFSGDFIVGFPGETDDDFESTLELVREVHYDQIFGFKYSPRPGTPAARLEDDVPVAVKKERLARLLATQEETWRQTAAAQIGARWSVVVEQPARRPAGAWQARTANNRKVLLLSDGQRVGDVLEVRVTGWEATTFVAEPVVTGR